MSYYKATAIFDKEEMIRLIPVATYPHQKPDNQRTTYNNIRKAILQSIERKPVLATFGQVLKDIKEGLSGGRG